MAKFDEFYFDSTTGKNRIHVISCTPDGDVTAVVQIIHGISEHIGRYRGFMQFLADNGIASVGDDHLGHGLSYTDKHDRGAFCDKDGWNHVVSDIAKLHDITVQKYPNVPYIMFGHSMGSFLLRTYMADYPDKYDKAIISGTGHQDKPVITAGCAVADIILKTKGYYSNGEALSKLAMGNYLARIAKPESAFDWLTHNREVINQYRDDELRVGDGKAGLYADMLKGVKYVSDTKNIRKVNKDKPVLFISGDEDPVGDYGKGVIKAYNCFKKEGVKDVTLKLYKGGRHEMLNELNRDEVYSDILKWIKPE